jgi:hypothetical protein
MRLSSVLIVLLALASSRANAQTPHEFQARCEAAFHADDTRGQIKWCKAASDRYALLAQRSSTFWHWAALVIGGVDLLDLSIAYNTVGDPVNAYKAAIRSRTALREFRFHCPLFAMRALATEPLRRVNDLINLYESPASPIPA